METVCAPAINKKSIKAVTAAYPPAAVQYVLPNKTSLMVNDKLSPKIVPLVKAADPLKAPQTQIKTGIEPLRRLMS